MKVTRTERERKVKISDFSGEEKKFQIDVSAECVVQWSFRRVSSRSKSAIALPKKVPILLTLVPIARSRVRQRKVKPMIGIEGFGFYLNYHKEMSLFYMGKGCHRGSLYPPEAHCSKSSFFNFDFS